ncbi:F-box/LRR-repeat protein 3 [Linum perenne]
MKRHQTTATSDYSYFDLLSDEVVFAILDFLGSNPLDRKSFSLVCRSFYHTESRHRRSVKPLRHEHLPRILSRYRSVSRLDLSLCPRISDGSLSLISGSCGETLRSIDLSRSRFFSYGGLVSLAVNCKNLVEIDLSNATELRDAAASAVAEAKNLEKLWLGRCKLITDMGVGCIAVGCKKLSDLGVGLIAVKCKELRSLDLSYLPITNKCLPAILKLQYLEDLVLEGCFGIDDDGLTAANHGCKSLKNISHVGLSSLISGSGSLQQLTLAYGSPVTLALANSLKMLSLLQSLKLDGCLVTSDGLKAILRLNTFESRGCSLITSLGLAAIAVGCRQLSKLDVKKCHSIDDAGMLPLAHFSQGLRQIILSYTSVTDVGLLSLASISCLQSITVLHLSGLTAGGLTAALLACCGLVKVKLHASFKPLLPPLLFEHLEARGCSFEWRDKEFQVRV